MPIISEFEPITEILTFLDSEGEVIEADQDYWVRLNPPTFKQQRIRDEYLDVHYTPGVGLVNKSNNKVLHVMEIWLTFAGTNLEIELPALNEDGSRKTKLTADNKYEPVNEIISFPLNESKELTQREFMEKMDRLPSFIIDAWHTAVITRAAPDWVLPF